MSSQEGRSLISQMVDEMAAEQSVALDSVDWLPETADLTHPLVIALGEKLERHDFQRVQVDDVPKVEETQRQVRATLKIMLDALLSDLV